MKKLSFALLLVLVVSMFTACIGTKPLDPVFDQTAVEEKAAEILEYFKNDDMQGVVDTMSADLAQAVPADKLEEVWLPHHEKIGGFDSVLDTIVSGSSDKSGGKYATVIYIAKFAEGKVQFTITFDTDMKLSGIYMK